MTEPEREDLAKMLLPLAVVMGFLMGDSIIWSIMPPDYKFKKLYESKPLNIYPSAFEYR